MIALSAAAAAAYTTTPHGGAPDCNQDNECIFVQSGDLLDDLENKLRGAADPNAIWAWVTEDWPRAGGVLAAIILVFVLAFYSRRKVDPPPHA